MIERRRNLWPLPGGAKAYAVNLQSLVQVVGSGASRSELEAAVADLAPTVTSASTLRGYASVPITLGMVERSLVGQLELTLAGRRYAKSGDLAVLRRVLVDRVFGAQELLEELKRGGSTYPEIAVRLEKRGIGWNYPMAVRYRVWWLVAAGAIDARRESRVDQLTLTTAGRRLAG